MNRTLILALTVLLAGAAPLRLEAQSPDEPVIRPLVEALRLEPGERIRVDGMLDEELWQRAVPATGFLQQEPREGQPATERTEVRIAYDRDNLYIGVLLHDSDPAGVVGNQLQRNAGLGSDDRFMWVLYTFPDGRGGYFFEINPAGLMGDGLLTSSGVNKSWDGIWETRVTRGAHGWSAEIRIPFRTLNFDPANTEWGVNFQRTVRRKSEESLWSGHRRNQGLQRPVHAGRLTGLHGISQGLGLEAKPYVVASRETVPVRAVAGSSDANLGMDINYSVTPGLRASLTLNTDFAEAEVDQRRVNLTRFPLVFPERRDFFLEGSAVFGFAQSSGPTPYFSRRIGLFDGTPVPVRAGARLAGQAGRYELGFLHVRTGSGVIGVAGIDARAVSPAEDFTVARVKRTILQQSTIGAVYTRRDAVTTLAAEPDDSATVLLATPEGHTLGVDLDLYTSRFRGNRNLQFEAFLVWHSEPFADATTTFNDRTARGVRLAYPNDAWAMHVSMREFGNSYAPPVGFATRRGFRRTQPTVNYSPRPDRWARVRQLDFGWHLEHLTDLDGRLQTFNNTLTLVGMRFTSGDNIEAKAGHNYERLNNPFRIYRAPGEDRSQDVVIAPGEYVYYGWEVGGSTAGRRRLSANANVQGGQFWSGNRLQLRGGGTVRPRPGVDIGVTYERNDVRLPEGRFATNLVRTTGGWHFSPLMSLTGSVQYDDVSRVVGTFTRFRWIVRPGSDIFLVYTHNLLDDPTSLDRFRALQTMERKAATKLTYTHRF
jgi:hypothetical protein